MLRTEQFFKSNDIGVERVILIKRSKSMESHLNAR